MVRFRTRLSKFLVCVGAVVGIVPIAGAGIASPLVHATSHPDAASGYQEPVLCEVDSLSESGQKALFALFRQPSDETPHSVLYAHRQNHQYRLRVFAEDCVDFECEFRNGISLEREDAMIIGDLNMDGFKDICILGGFRQGTGKPWYKAWRFDPVKKAYVWSRIVD